MERRRNSGALAPWIFALLGLRSIVVAADDEVAIKITSEVSDNSKVQVLTASDFDERVLNSKAPWLIKFYAPWCGHCKAMEPAWKMLAKKLKGTVNVAKVDCIAERALGDEYDVEGFPMIKLIAEGKQYLYQGPRTPDAIELFATRTWKMGDSELLPKDKPFNDRLMKVVQKYCLPISFVMIVGMLVWLCCSAGPTPEQIAKRKAFEERLKEYERLAIEKKRKMDEAKLKKAVEGEDKKENAEEKEDTAETQKDPKTATEKKDD